jgi:hypothetical protein
MKLTLSSPKVHTGSNLERMLMKGDSGVSAMVRCALWLEDKLGLETLNIGREGLDPKDSCTLTMFGRHLFYAIKLDGGFVFVSAELMDAGDPPEQLLSIGDGPEGWRTITRLIAALERNKIKSLERPIEIGGTGPNAWVIGD